MGFLSDTDRQGVINAVRQAESRTGGELVTVIARQADTYLYIPLLWASLLALILPGVAWLLGLSHPFMNLYAVPLATFLAFALLFRWTPLKMRLIPTSVKRRRASRLAWEQFFAQNLHLTRERTGLLLFVSVAEHYVEILADKGINDNVEDGAWDQIITDFIAHVKAGEIAQGFVSAIGACGDILAEAYPRPVDDSNQLPNRPGRTLTSNLD